MSRTTMAVLTAILAALIAAAVIVHRSRQPRVAAESPLASMSTEQIVRIGVTVNGSTTTLRVVDGQWRIASPFEDRADAERVARLLSALKDFRIGSVLSENPERHANYDLNQASATRLQVFVKGSEAPVIDYLVGKAAADIESSFIRLPGSAEVRTAEGLSTYLLPRNPEDFRSTRVVGFSPESISGLSASGAAEMVIEGSTGTWINGKTKRILPPEVQRSIRAAVRAWRASSFTVSDPAGQGFAKPHLIVDFRRGEETATVTVGGFVPDRSPAARYIRTSDRPAVLIVPDLSTADLIEALKKAE